MSLVNRPFTDTESLTQRQRHTHRQKQHAVHPEGRVAGVERQPGEQSSVRTQSMYANLLSVSAIFNKYDNEVSLSTCNL